jgi:hypothetical protein
MSMRVLREAFWTHPVRVGALIDADFVSDIGQPFLNHRPDTETPAAHLLSPKPCQFAHASPSELGRQRLFS